MAVEARRGCGYRNVGDLYLVSHEIGFGLPCDRLPFELTVCPTCSHRFKQTRGWRWIDLNAFVCGPHVNCGDGFFPCPLCMNVAPTGRAGLLWISERFYRRPYDFIKEAFTLGVSQRISAVPRGFVIGSTWVLLAHPKTIPCHACAGGGLQVYAPTTGQPHKDPMPCEKCKSAGWVAGIFRMFRPTAVEIIVTQSQSQRPDFMADLEKRGLRPVVVPDNDPDHEFPDRCAQDRSGHEEIAAQTV